MKSLALLLLLATSSKASQWSSKLDYSPNVSPIMIRELHDGQWLAGITKENIYHLDYTSDDPSSVWNGQRFHAGVFQAWNAEHGNPTFGMVAGLDIPAYHSAAIGAIGSALNLAETFKPAQYAGDMLSIDGLLGYRPLHTADVHGDLTYGVAFRLKTSFGINELKKGL